MYKDSEETQEERWNRLADQAKRLAQERISIWEYKHGALGDDSRDCMLAIIYGALMTPVSAMLVEADPDKPILDALKAPKECFCEAMGKDE